VLVASVVVVGLFGLGFGLRSLVDDNTTTVVRSSAGSGQVTTTAVTIDPGSEPMRLVDMPGYGFAAVSKEKISTWTQLMHAYLRGRASLARVYVLVDGRHGLKPPDTEMFDLLDSSAMSYQVVLTKKDEVKKSDVESRLEGVREGLARRPAAHPEVLFTSSETREGIGELREGIARLLKERGVSF
jgi:GTP-binding protein